MTKHSTGSYHEIEFKLDSNSDDLLRQIQAWVVSNPLVFTPSTHPEFLAGIPSYMRQRFQRPMEVTEPRVRLYWDNRRLDGVANGIEIRQEMRGKGGVKQMIKLGGNASKDDPILDRMEYPAKLDAFGVDLEAVEDKKARRSLKNTFGEVELKPLICMISQRTRIKYHPEGDRDLEIELGFDYPCVGLTFDLISWEGPQMELELVKGPDDHVAARAVLEREATRFEQKFSVSRNVTSKPTPGFKHLSRFLKTDEGAQAFDKLNPEGQWWLGAPGNPRPTLINAVAPKAAAG